MDVSFLIIGQQAYGNKKNTMDAPLATSSPKISQTPVIPFTTVTGKTKTSAVPAATMDSPTDHKHSKVTFNQENGSNQATKPAPPDIPTRSDSLKRVQKSAIKPMSPGARRKLDNSGYLVNKPLVGTRDKQDTSVHFDTDAVDSSFKTGVSDGSDAMKRSSGYSPVLDAYLGIDNKKIPRLTVKQPQYEQHKGENYKQVKHLPRSTESQAVSSGHHFQSQAQVHRPAQFVSNLRVGARLFDHSDLNRLSIALLQKRLKSINAGSATKENTDSKKSTTDTSHSVSDSKQDSDKKVTKQDSSQVTVKTESAPTYVRLTSLSDDENDAVQVAENAKDDMFSTKSGHQYPEHHHSMRVTDAIRTQARELEKVPDVGIQYHQVHKEINQDQSHRSNGIYKEADNKFLRIGERLFDYLDPNRLSAAFEKGRPKVPQQSHNQSAVENELTSSAHVNVNHNSNNNNSHNMSENYPPMGNPGTSLENILPDQKVMFLIGNDEADNYEEGKPAVIYSDHMKEHAFLDDAPGMPSIGTSSLMNMNQTGSHDESRTPLLEENPSDPGFDSYEAIMETILTEIKEINRFSMEILQEDAVGLMELAQNVQAEQHYSETDDTKNEEELQKDRQQPPGGVTVISSSEPAQGQTIVMSEETYTSMPFTVRMTETDEKQWSLRDHHKIVEEEHEDEQQTGTDIDNQHVSPTLTADIVPQEVDRELQLQTSEINEIQAITEELHTVQEMSLVEVVSPGEVVSTSYVQFYDEAPQVVHLNSLNWFSINPLKTIQETSSSSRTSLSAMSEESCATVITKAEQQLMHQLEIEETYVTITSEEVVEEMVIPPKVQGDNRAEADHLQYNNATEDQFGVQSSNKTEENLTGAVYNRTPEEHQAEVPYNKASKEDQAEVQDDRAYDQDQFKVLHMTASEKDKIETQYNKASEEDQVQYNSAPEEDQVGVQYNKPAEEGQVIVQSHDIQVDILNVAKVQIATNVAEPEASKDVPDFKNSNRSTYPDHTEPTVNDAFSQLWQQQQQQQQHHQLHHQHHESPSHPYETPQSPLESPTSPTNRFKPTSKSIMEVYHNRKTNCPIDPIGQRLCDYDDANRLSFVFQQNAMTPNLSSRSSSHTGKDQGLTLPSSADLPSPPTNLIQQPFEIHAQEQTQKEQKPAVNHTASSEIAQPNGQSQEMQQPMLASIVIEKQHIHVQQQHSEEQQLPTTNYPVPLVARVRETEMQFADTLQQQHTSALHAQQQQSNYVLEIRQQSYPLQQQHESTVTEQHHQNISQQENAKALQQQQHSDILQQQQDTNALHQQQTPMLQTQHTNILQQEPRPAEVLQENESSIQQAQYASVPQQHGTVLQLLDANTLPEQQVNTNIVQQNQQLEKIIEQQGQQPTGLSQQQEQNPLQEHVYTQQYQTQQPMSTLHKLPTIPEHSVPPPQQSPIRAKQRQMLQQLQEQQQQRERQMLLHQQLYLQKQAAMKSQQKAASNRNLSNTSSKSTNLLFPLMPMRDTVGTRLSDYDDLNRLSLVMQQQNVKYS